MSAKRWSYKQITEHAEREIRSSLESARDSKDYRDRHIYRCFAMGAHASWYSLTCGWQDPADARRLRELIHPSEPS